MEKLNKKNWQTMLNKPKNLALKVKGTGVTEKLEKYSKDEEDYGNTYDVANAEKVIARAKELGEHARTVAHKIGKLFTEASKYLLDMWIEAGQRVKEVEKDIKKM